MAIFNPTGDVTGKARIIERTFDGDPNPSTLSVQKILLVPCWMRWGRRCFAFAGATAQLTYRAVTSPWHSTCSFEHGLLIAAWISAHPQMGRQLFLQLVNALRTQAMTRTSSSPVKAPLQPRCMLP
ncbi:hypothetical protein FHX10_005895 [Rhizobium sp. BK591]|uniref:hypothetical protein n=1 Tax=Rhizobium TaxID=379 RepID=UPI000645D591|nr:MULTISPECIES: hypothetical protein [Rhizobium]MBB3371153.1 hypothetical protein [Rhizobium sp. BK077]MBB3746344.1 hypothetical protein [Rhizobium sp. BK591]MBB4181921.1 hypothetical protein [Rhizobium sp. BK109]